MPTLRIYVKWSNNLSGFAVEQVDTTTEFQINEPDDPVGDWLIEVENGNRGWWVRETKRVNNCRLSEVLDVEQVVCPARGKNPEVRMSNLRAWEMYACGQFRVVRNRWGGFVATRMAGGKTPSDYGKLAMQIERSSASIEGRPARRFLGLSARII